MFEKYQDLFKTVDEKNHLILFGCFIISFYFLIFRPLSTTTKSNANNNKYNDDDRIKIPVAPGSIPFLGHALSYKSDPASFLRRCCNVCGPIFRINLAGQHMIAVAGTTSTTIMINGHDDVVVDGMILIQQITTQPKSILSSSKAVANLGFDYTLGMNNVINGPGFHKLVLKNNVWNNMDVFVGQVSKSLQDALDVELKYEKQKNKCAATFNNHNSGRVEENKNKRIYVSDLFALARRTVMRTVVSAFIGTCLLLDDSLGHDDGTIDILNEMMNLEDYIEDATAKAAVLPTWISTPFILKPVKWKREKLQKKIAFRIEKEHKQRLMKQYLEEEENDDDNGNKDKDNYTNKFHENQYNERWGPWLVAMEQCKMNYMEISELIVGLIFAAHKNAAIASAQTLCMLLEDYYHTNLRRDHHDNVESVDDDEYKVRNGECFYDNCVKEASDLLSKIVSASDNNNKNNNNINMKAIEEAIYLKCCINETLRLSAHSIGAIREACRSMKLVCTNNSIGKNNNYNDDGYQDKKDEGTKEKCSYHFSINVGETIAILHNATNTNSNVWGDDALEYKPSRFLLLRQEHERQEQEKKKRKEEKGGERVAATKTPLPKTATFSNGINKCPGEKVAYVIIEIFVSLLLNKNISLVQDNNNIPPISFERATLAQRNGPIGIILDDVD